MRPVQRPDIDKTYTTYKSYLKPLIKSFGQYCSYCERPDKLDVEHVVPKSKDRDLEVAWSNLLLGCARCNRDFKKDKNDSRYGYLWPDKHDTFHAFIYEETGRVIVNPKLDDATQQAAERLKSLVKLEDGLEQQKTLNLGRKAAFNQAKMMKGLFDAGALDADSLMVMIKNNSFWSVWMTVFADVPDVKERLLNDPAFPGTAKQYFHSESKTVALTTTRTQG